MTFFRNTFLAAGLAALSATALAAPFTVDLTGTISHATGGAVPFLGTPVNAQLIIDLDPANFNEVNTTDGRYTLSSPPPNDQQPYDTSSISGNFGTFTQPDYLDLYLIDNIDLDAIGNPHNLTGVRDVLEVNLVTDIVTCAPQNVDPITGCTDNGAAREQGEDYQVFFVFEDTWFDGVGTLPGVLPDFNDFVAVVGEFEGVDNFVQTAYAEFVFSGFTQAPLNSNANPVPAPAGASLVLAGLFGLGLFGRRVRRS